VVVVPDVSLIFKGGAACKSLTDCGTGPIQPRSAQAILGRNFERLTGDEVTTILGTRALVASAHYAWPNDACRKPLDLASGTPRICAPSSATINEDEAGANVEAVAESIAILLRANRVCDLYNFTTAEFQRRTSWSEFRSRILRWRKTPTLYAMSRGGFRKKGPETTGVLNSPAFIESGYHIWGKTAAYATFVAQPARSGGTKWEIAQLKFS
jgi:hypothetical protein